MNKVIQRLAILEQQHGSKVKNTEKHKQRTRDIWSRNWANCAYISECRVTCLISMKA